MKHKIIIADDSVLNRKIIIAILKMINLDIEILEAGDGVDTLDILSKNEISLIILDIMMPNKDGLKVLEEMKNEKKYDDVSVIMCSALDDIENIKKSLLLGALDYFVKPLNEEQMKIMIPLKIRNALKFYEQRKIVEEYYKASLAEGDRKLLNELTSKNKQLEELIYIASHDLRTPLVNINGFGQRLEKLSKELSANFENPKVFLEKMEESKIIINEKIPNAVHFMSVSGEKMNNLIEGLLKLSRTGMGSLEPQIINMNYLIANILDSMDYNLKSISSMVKVDNLPNCFADPNLINQVFTNLFDNAIKYRQQNKILEINVRAVRHGNNITYIVKDNGKGIAANQLENIWKVFFRCDYENSIIGEGLGLSITKKIIERSEGKSWVESIEGEGTSFFIELPNEIK